jgi:hypothetical protein
MSDENEEKSRVITKVIFLKKKIDKEIGYNYWKKYVASVFWSQISTPINLTITMLTAVTTAQIQSNDLITPTIASNLAIVSLILATLNTFFRPHTQYATNTELLTKWTNLGVKFEDEYYNNMVEHKTLGGYRKRLESLQAIQKEVNALRQSEGTNTINFLTDFIFLLSFNSCLRNKKNWLDRDKGVEQAANARIAENKKEGRRTKKVNFKEVKERLGLNEIIEPDEELESEKAKLEEQKPEEQKPEEQKPEEQKPEESDDVKVPISP